MSEGINHISVVEKNHKPAKNIFDLGHRKHKSLSRWSSKDLQHVSLVQYFRWRFCFVLYFFRSHLSFFPVQSHTHIERNVFLFFFSHNLIVLVYDRQNQNYLFKILYLFIRINMVDTQIMFFDMKIVFILLWFCTFFLYMIL